MTSPPFGAGQDRAANLDAARLLLSSLGITPADLLDTAAPRPPAPTFAVYVPVVSDAVSPGTRKTYQPYWNYVVDRWGTRGIDEPSPSEIKAFSQVIKAQAEQRGRRNARGGTSAVENFIAAMRCLYRHAEADDLIDHHDNPASKVDKPRRADSPRYALPPDQLVSINHYAATTGNDPELDALLLRFHTETAARRQGGLNLRPQDLDAEQCLVYLREKGSKHRWQPVSPTLMRHLRSHAKDRHSVEPHKQLFRYRSGQPITSRRYDHLWDRLGRHLPWIYTQDVSTHWLRHTTLTWVSRAFGRAVASGYAGHSSKASTNHDGTIGVYDKATLQEIARALEALTGEPHPLATTRID
ncbi:integrase [Amycolatopsis coloradensis]|uniref:Integrase n=1 Tax=Amycolatopsis coloradensis TaxID=76021 RepID=A0A1R0KJL0_9PSEU|nr:integrase [Amycolatopsis coloradensis]